MRTKHHRGFARAGNPRSKRGQDRRGGTQNQQLNQDHQEPSQNQPQGQYQELGAGSHNLHRTRKGLRRSHNSNSVAAHRAIRTPSPVRALLWRWRWVLVALLIGTLTQSVLAAISAKNPHTTQVVVAATALNTGDTLGSDNIKLAYVPTELVPAGAINEIAAAKGHMIVAPLPKGAPIFANQLFTSAFAAAPPPGTVINAIQLDDEATLAVLRPGDLLQLYAPPTEMDSSSEAKLLTRSALVMAVRDDVGGGGILGDSSQKGAIFVAIPRNDANLVIGLGAKDPLHAVIVAR